MILFYFTYFYLLFYRFLKLKWYISGILYFLHHMDILGCEFCDLKPEVQL
jgi:hypothetical protein